LRVLLDHLLTLPRLEENPRLYEFGFQLMYELAVDPVTRGPVVELLGRPKYDFFSKVRRVPALSSKVESV
jgi:nuclear pore complex protein Nup205